jgi:hypothetical protein
MMLYVRCIISFISTLLFCFMQLWDLHDILIGSGKTVTSEADIALSDSDEMKTETSLPKNNKGIPGLLQNFM